MITIEKTQAKVYKKPHRNRHILASAPNRVVTKKGAVYIGRGEGEEGLLGCIQKTDIDATVGYGEQVGVPICLEHGLLLPRKSGQAITVAQGACKVLGIERLGGGTRTWSQRARLRDVQIAEKKAMRISSAAWILGGGRGESAKPTTMNRWGRKKVGSRPVTSARCRVAVVHMRLDRGQSRKIWRSSSGSVQQRGHKQLACNPARNRVRRGTILPWICLYWTSVTRLSIWLRYIQRKVFFQLIWPSRRSQVV